MEQLLLGLSLLKLTYKVSKKTWQEEVLNKFDIEDYFLEAEEIYIKAMDEDILAFKKSMESQKRSRDIIKDIIEILLNVVYVSKKLHIIAIELEPYIKKM